MLFDPVSVGGPVGMAVLAARTKKTAAKTKGKGGGWAARLSVGSWLEEASRWLEWARLAEREYLRDGEPALNKATYNLQQAFQELQARQGDARTDKQRAELWKLDSVAHVTLAQIYQGRQSVAAKAGDSGAARQARLDADEAVAHAKASAQTAAELLRGASDATAEDREAVRRAGVLVGSTAAHQATYGAQMQREADKPSVMGDLFGPGRFLGIPAWGWGLAGVGIALLMIATDKGAPAPIVIRGEA